MCEWGSEEAAKARAFQSFDFEEGGACTLQRKRCFSEIPTNLREKRLTYRNNRWKATQDACFRIRVEAVGVGFVGKKLLSGYFGLSTLHMFGVK